VALTGAIVEARLRRVDAASREVNDLTQTFEAFAQLAEQSSAPRVIRLRVNTSRAQLAALSEHLTKRRTDVLELVDKVAEAKGGVAAMRAATEGRVIEARRELSASSEEPIWKLKFSGRAEWNATTARLARDAQRSRTWFADNVFAIALLAVAFLGGMALVAFRLRAKAGGRVEGAPPASTNRLIRGRPVAAAICVTILGIVALAPEAPMIVYDLAWLLAAPAAALVGARMLGPDLGRTVWVLAGALALAPIETAAGDLPFAQRVVLILQTAPLAVVFGLDLYHGRVSGRIVGARAWRPLRLVAWLLVACLAAATAGSILGWVGLASILAAGALGTLGSIVVIQAGYLVLAEAIRSLLVPNRDRGLLMVRAHSVLVTETCLTVLRVIGVVSAVYVSVHAFGLQHALRKLLSEILGARATFGTISISVGAIVEFVLVIAIAVFLSKLLGFVLAEEILPRLNVRRGAAYAISGTTRYLVLLGGFVLAAGVTGIDLTTFGFLAGALGVGIGFGLQNIVSNFISGLILLFERPIQVGDTVDVSGVTGFVTKIGIRASTVQTFDGSEVIVPNADLISKSVTNWTRSNSNRRFDIPVGVAYGSSLEATVQALLAAARRTAGVIPAPAPEAYFKGFGESSLDWALRAWVRVEDSPKILSDLKRAMSEELGKAGITVAFPQRVVHLQAGVSEA
jgi:potassium-dependent mechanosensitive channel